MAVERLRIRKLSRSWLADILVSEIRPHHIAKFRDERLKQASAAACLRDLSLLSHAITTATQEWSFNLLVNPVSKIRMPTAAKARTRRLTKGEEERLLAGCRRSNNHWHLPLVFFAIETGMRRGEILSLEWKDVHLEQGWEHLEETKNGTPRDVPLSIRAKGILTDLPRDISGFNFSCQL